MSRLFTALIVLAMVAGVGAGWACRVGLAPDQAKEAAHAFGLVVDLFLRLIRMVIAPLVFSTLVSGVAQMEGAAAVGRVGGKALAWFLVASLVSLSIGLVVARVLQPGAAAHLAHAAVAGAGDAPAGALTIEGFLSHLAPTSIVDAMARNEILQIVLFAVLAGAAMSALPGRAAPLLQVVEQVAAVMLKITGYVMRLAPLAVFAALAGTVAERGLDVLWSYLRFVESFYIGVAALWAVLLASAVLFCGWRAIRLLGAIREPLLLAFATTSSEAAYPKLLERLKAFGVPARIAGFVLPLGYSFNLDGAMMYATLAILFIAQAFGASLSLGQQMVLLLVLMVSTKGLAGVPRAVIVVIAALLPYFHLPAAGVALILGVDHILDMGRAATNVLGNSVASLVVARWEGALEPPSAEQVKGAAAVPRQAER
jgi:Na+/H+-dicarboxylate symporter